MENDKIGSSIIPSYKGLSEFTGICIPNLRKLVNRRTDPLPSIRVSERKLCFVSEDVLQWFHDEAERQTGGAAKNGGKYYDGQ